MNLYVARIEFEVVIASEEPPDEWEIKDAAREELSNGGLVDGPPTKVTPTTALEGDWWDSYPYGENNNKTCRQIIDEWKPDVSPLGEQESLFRKERDRQP